MPPERCSILSAVGFNAAVFTGDDSDRQDFLSRLGQILRETRTTCYAWALMPNHFHLLLRHYLVHDLLALNK
jgi:REP element-mobilizing transposase RayT